MVISDSLQACGVVFPFAMLTSICRSIVTICSGLYLLIGMTSFSSKWILSHSTWYKFRRSRHFILACAVHFIIVGREQKRTYDEIRPYIDATLDKIGYRLWKPTSEIPMDALGEMLLLQYQLHSFIGIALRNNARPELQKSYVEINVETDMT